MQVCTVKVVLSDEEVRALNHFFATENDRRYTTEELADMREAWLSMVCGEAVINGTMPLVEAARKHRARVAAQLHTDDYYL
jgi:hypothetical protein